MLGQTFSSEFPTPKQGRTFIAIYSYIRKQLPSEVNSLGFYLGGHLKTLIYSAAIEKEETLHQRICDGCQNISQPCREI